MTDNRTLATKPHYAILDGLRGVAALMVVIFHICEPHAPDHLDLIINHGYLAVDFFFLLSGFVIGYAYDDRWTKLTIGGFFRRRLERLQPMVIMGMIIGAICFYFGDSKAFPLIHTIPMWRMLVVMLIGFTLIPVPISMDIRGWQEMHPLDGPGWSLFFEYIANILYALGLRKLPKWALTLLVVISAGALVNHLVLGKYGDVIGGWSLNEEQLKIGFTRMMFPFFGGLLLFRVAKPTHIKNSFLWCSVLLVAILCMPRLGGAEKLWLNGLYESVVIIALFPLIVYMGASGTVKTGREAKICKFLGDISYPIYITHYAFIYVYTGWVSNHPGVGFTTALPWALLVFFGSITVAYACLKLYDEPVRAWLKRKVA
ncbi:acyltransferase [Mucilaginibacter sp. RS28]|uniref:Acyltransferase n=1 Tax=Mucilaginibacter straminoryzae TaxID=2932774 RepID=A0A9X1X4I2_9SPHI|nr:acyltransferase [Mucilaginibacter straminoryzae]MCJ8210836.1 acyltransferase [Mucilaginibacter straminoryzae]